MEHPENHGDGAFMPEKPRSLPGGRGRRCADVGPGRGAERVGGRQFCGGVGGMGSKVDNFQGLRGVYAVESCWQ